MIKKLFQLFILIFSFFVVCYALAETYYIDWENGSDYNDGLSKNTPWKRAPGMRGCWITDPETNCVKKAKQGGKPGDQFILKGGVIWPREALSWDWYFGSGTSSNPIYFGVDQTWYKGNSWTRPKLDAQGQPPYPSPYFTGIMRAYGLWLIVDNIEFLGLPLLDDNPIGMLAIGTGVFASGEVKNCYFHGWSRGGTATQDVMFLLTSTLVSEGSTMDLKIFNNVCD